MAPKATAPRSIKRPASAERSSARSRSPRGRCAGPKELQGLHAYIVNLERRKDRWDRVAKMLKKETPWMEFEKFPASDGREMTIPEKEVSTTWNTKIKAQYAGCGEGAEWVYEAPGTKMHGKQWKWVADVAEEEDDYRFIVDDDGQKGTVIKKRGGAKLRVRKQISKQYLAGQTQALSGGERGCAHSHYRLWKVAAERKDPTLVLEDDVQFVFERSEPKLGMFNGKHFTERLVFALQHAPKDFDVLYLGWSGHRGGNFKIWSGLKERGLTKEGKKYLRRAEYVWTTVAYVITPAGAAKLLKAAKPLNMPVDEFMAAEACQERLKSFVALDEGDDDAIWAGGLVDQFDFQGDSDIKKSDGGVQGDNIKEFVASGGA